ncbi:hypothetical protein BC833DRAFT_598314 [Globomyces pollinis-pini]|nr:hypothetical protein BC833DRAFT_598314 [Globomyces pollinis-pini]
MIGRQEETRVQTRKFGFPLIKSNSTPQLYNALEFENLPNQIEMKPKSRPGSAVKPTKESIMFEKLYEFVKYKDSSQGSERTLHKKNLEKILDIVQNKNRPKTLSNGFEPETWYRLSGEAQRYKRSRPPLPPPESKQAFIKRIATSLPADAICSRMRLTLSQEHPSEVHSIFRRMDKLDRKNRSIVDKDTFVQLLSIPKDFRSNENLQCIDDYLRILPAFQTTPEYIFPHLAKELSVVSYPKDHILFRQGDPGDKWYVILEGTISISIKKPGYVGPPPIPQIAVASMKDGDKFGDLALLNDLLRSTSVTISSGHCTFITLDKLPFVRLMGPANKHEISEKISILKKVYLFSTMDRKTLKQVADKTVARHADGDAVLIKEGQVLATTFVIRKGTCAVFRNVTFKKKGSSKKVVPVLVGHLGQFEVFNQESIASNTGAKIASPFTVVSVGEVEYSTVIIQKEWLDSGLTVKPHPFSLMNNEELVRRFQTTKLVTKFRHYQKKYIDATLDERKASDPIKVHTF